MESVATMLLTQGGFFETFQSNSEDSHMMSRLDWMTYLKVMFDKLLVQANNRTSMTNVSGLNDDSDYIQKGGPFSLNQTTLSGQRKLSSVVDANKLLDAFLQIKTHLPLKPREEYVKIHGNERGFNVKEVESNLKRVVITKSVHGVDQTISWDDIIDLFILCGNNANYLSINHNKQDSQHSINAVQHNQSRNTSSSCKSNHWGLQQPFENSKTKPGKAISSGIEEVEHDDLVNISNGFYGGCSMDQDEEFKINSDGKQNICNKDALRVIKQSHQTQQFKAHDGDQNDEEDDCMGELDESQQQNMNINELDNNDQNPADQSSSTLFSQFLQHGQIIEMPRSTNAAIEDSPPVEKIVKKIDFKDTCTNDGSISSEGRYLLLPKTSQKHLNRQNNESSKGTLVCNTNNQNCSFYLTPSSGSMTPVQLNQNKSSRMLQHYQMITEQAMAENQIVAEEYMRVAPLNNQNNIKGGRLESNKVFTYYEGAAPFESLTKLENTFSQNQLVSPFELSLDSRCFDIDHSSHGVSAFKVNIQKEGILRSVDLSKNRLTCFQGILSKVQASQIIILNLSRNTISSLKGIQNCENLRFLNLSFNKITSLEGLTVFKSLQEAYFSNNQISSLLIQNWNKMPSNYPNTKSNQKQFGIGPLSSLQILDFSSNKLSEPTQIISFLENNQAPCLQIIALKGNNPLQRSFDEHLSKFNISLSKDLRSKINFKLSSEDIIKQYSHFYRVEKLQKPCFQGLISTIQIIQTAGATIKRDPYGLHQKLPSLKKNNYLNKTLQQRGTSHSEHSNASQGFNTSKSQKRLGSYSSRNMNGVGHQMFVPLAPQSTKAMISKTRIDLRPLHQTENDIFLQISPSNIEAPSTQRDREIVGLKTLEQRFNMMRSVQEEHLERLFSRPASKVATSQNNLKFKPAYNFKNLTNRSNESRKKQFTSVIIEPGISLMFNPKRTGTQSLGKKYISSSVTRLPSSLAEMPLGMNKENQHINLGSQKAMSQNFNQALNLLTQKLSLKEKQKAVNGNGCSTSVFGAARTLLNVTANPEKVQSRNIKYFDIEKQLNNAESNLSKLSGPAQQPSNTAQASLPTLTSYSSNELFPQQSVGNKNQQGYRSQFQAFMKNQNVAEIKQNLLRNGYYCQPNSRQQKHFNDQSNSYYYYSNVIQDKSQQSSNSSLHHHQHLINEDPSCSDFHHSKTVHQPGRIMSTQQSRASSNASLNNKEHIDLNKRQSLLKDQLKKSIDMSLGLNVSCQQHLSSSINKSSNGPMPKQQTLKESTMTSHHIHNNPSQDMNPIVSANSSLPHTRLGSMWQSLAAVTAVAGQNNGISSGNSFNHLQKPTLHNKQALESHHCGPVVEDMPMIVEVVHGNHEDENYGKMLPVKQQPKQNVVLSVTSHTSPQSILRRMKGITNPYKNQYNQSSQRISNKSLSNSRTALHPNDSHLNNENDINVLNRPKQQQLKLGSLQQLQNKSRSNVASLKVGYNTKQFAKTSANLLSKKV